MATALKLLCEEGQFIDRGGRKNAANQLPGAIARLLKIHLLLNASHPIFGNVSKPEKITPSISPRKLS